MSYQTPEAAHSELIKAIDYELDHYGPASLADMIATLVSNRYDEDAPKPDDEAWKTVQQAYTDLAERLNAPSLWRHR